MIAYVCILSGSSGGHKKVSKNSPRHSEVVIPTPRPGRNRVEPGNFAEILRCVQNLLTHTMSYEKKRFVHSQEAYTHQLRYDAEITALEKRYWKN